jgi:hypothetical protein
VSAPEHEGAHHVTARRATADVAVQLVARAVSLVLGIFTTLLVVRTLGDARFGQWSTIVAVVDIVGYLAGSTASSRSPWSERPPIGSASGNGLEPSSACVCSPRAWRPW